MAFNEALAARIEKILEGQDALSKKQMFGGLSFFVGGNMACGVIGDELIVRIEPDQTESTLAERHTRAFDFTGRPMKGWIVVQPEGVKAAKDLKGWVERGLNYVRTLPPKK